MAAPVSAREQSLKEATGVNLAGAVGFGGFAARERQRAGLGGKCPPPTKPIATDWFTEVDSEVHSATADGMGSVRVAGPKGWPGAPKSREGTPTRPRGLLKAAAGGYSWFDRDTLAQGVEVFEQLYIDHLTLEESLAYPEARARIDPTTLARASAEMAQRRAQREARPAKR